MITIKKKKTKLLARILALIGIVCILVASFSISSFAWEAHSQDYLDYQVHALTPINNVQIYYQESYQEEKVFSCNPNNSVFLSGISEDGPDFPIEQRNGLVKNTLDIEKSTFLSNGHRYISALYNFETIFSPTFLGADVYGHLQVQAEEVLLFANLISRRIKGNDDYKPLYEYFTYICQDKNAVDNHNIQAPTVSYGCTYIYLSDDRSTVCTKERYKRLTMEKHDSSDGYYRYYLYEDILENAPENLQYVYVDYLYGNTDSNSYDVSIGYGNTYYKEEVDPVLTYTRLDFAELFSYVADEEYYKGIIEGLENDYDSLYLTYSELLDDYYDMFTQVENLKEISSEYSILYYQLLSEFYAKDEEISAKNTEIKELEKKNFELRNTSGAIEEFFDGMSSAIWEGLDDISDIGYSYVDSGGVRRTVTIGSLITVTVVGVVAFFVIKLFRGG